MNTKVRPRAFDIPDYDPRLLQHMTYRNQISDPVSSPQLDPPDLTYEYEKRYLFVTSAMRDRTQYPDPAYFKVQFPETYRDIYSIELSAGTLPNAGNISGDGYLLLDIPELNHIEGVDGSKYFGILGLQTHPNRSFFNLDKANTNDMPVIFKPIKARLDGITIMLRHPDGSLVTFGSENPAAPANFANQMQLTFEIRLRVKRRIGIDRDFRTVVMAT
jgi:hypothetical protein